MFYTALYVLAIWNIIVMLTYGWDKLCAKRGKRRVREAALLTIAFLLGSTGAMFGMVLFNHKTAKIKFRLAVPFFILFHWVLAYLIIFRV